MQRPKDAANPSSRPYSLTSVLIKGVTRCGNDGLLPLPVLTRSERHTHNRSFMAGHSRPKDGVASLAYDPAIQSFLSLQRTRMPGNDGQRAGLGA